MTLPELRLSLGMKENSLLISEDGTLGDLLGIDGEDAIIGILASGKIIKVHLDQLKPNKQKTEV